MTLEEQLELERALNKENQIYRTFIHKSFASIITLIVAAGAKGPSNLEGEIAYWTFPVVKEFIDSGIDVTVFDYVNETQKEAIVLTLDSIRLICADLFDGKALH